MVAGDCPYCGGSGFWHSVRADGLKWSTTLHRYEPSYLVSDDPCPYCDGTGKKGYVRLWTRIKRFFAIRAARR